VPWVAEDAISTSPVPVSPLVLRGDGLNPADGLTGDSVSIESHAVGSGVFRVEVDGHSIAYRSSGSGPPLLLLHGFLCDSRVWRRQLEGLADEFTVIAWDAPGGGDSSDPPEAFGIADWARALDAFLDELGIDRTMLLGLSWGGLLAQELYRSAPKRIIALVLADTYAGWKGSLGEEVAQQRLERCLRESTLSPDDFVRRWVPVEFFTHPSPELIAEMAEVVSGFHPVGFRLMAKTLAESDTTDLLPTIEVPTLLIWGESDVRSPRDVAERFRTGIPGAELAVIPSAGHVSNMEQPEAFSAHVRRFCGEHSA
jgi:pimeloyl-ACP methyl ester carboxylesterase